MSLIENALDLAKRQRETRTQPEISRRAEQIHSAEPVRTAYSPPSSLASLDFSKLPQLRLDNRLLRENRILTPESSKEPGEVAYRMLRTRVMRIMRNSGWNTLGIVAAGPAEGKTLTAVNLAISIAAEVGQQAVLVDLDLRRPTVSRYMGIPDGSFLNLSDFLEGRTDDVGNLLISPGIARLACVLNSRPLERSSDLLASAQAHRFIDGLRHACPGALIVFDLPPLLATDDALVVAPILDGFLFVVADGRAKREEVTSARQLLQEFNVIGTVLNKSIEQDTRSYYY